MMENKRYILPFVVTIAIFLLAFQWTIGLLGDGDTNITLTGRFLMNLPVCIVIGILDMTVISVVRKRLKSRSSILKINLDLVITAFFAIIIVLAANYALMGSDSFEYNLVSNFMPLIL